MSTSTPPAYSQMLAERFAKAFAAFVDAVRDGVRQAALNPALNGSPSLLVWQTQDLPRLERENAEVQNALALFLVGETGTIATIASQRRHLARELDGADLNFAGPDLGKILDQLETAVVVAAYQVCSAAKIP